MWKICAVFQEAFHLLFTSSSRKAFLSFPFYTSNQTKSEDYCLPMQSKWIITCHGISLRSSHPWGNSWSPWDWKQLTNTGCAVSTWTFWTIPHHVLPIIPFLLKCTSKAWKLWHMWWWYISSNAPDVITFNFSGTLATIHTQPVLSGCKRVIRVKCKYLKWIMGKIWQVLIEPLKDLNNKKDVYCSPQWKGLKLFRPWKLSSTCCSGNTAVLPPLYCNPASLSHPLIAHAGVPMSWLFTALSI